MSEPLRPVGATFDLTGRVALVTGASSGLGRRFARLLAGAGARVVLAARRAGHLRELQAEIAAAGGQAVAVAADVADARSIAAAYAAGEAAFGPIDTIVANAGINVPGTAIELPPEDYDRIMAVNLRGVFLTVREGAGRLIAAGSRERQHGRIVIVSSIAAHHLDPGLAVYSASKAGVLQLGRALARDWIRDGISVNMLCPGYVLTEINSDWFATAAGERRTHMFHRRRLMPSSALDVPLLFLASDLAQAVTGACFTIDDGQSL